MSADTSSLLRPAAEHYTEHVDPEAWEETASVFLDPPRLSDEGETLPASICISYKVDLSPAQAREVGNRLVYLADRLTPASAEGLAALEVPLSVINDLRGTSHTMETVAAGCGVNLAEATAADVLTMAGYIGGVLASA